MSMIERGGYALASTALLTGVVAWGLNQTGLAKKVMKTSAPTFMNACKYGALRGTVTFAITAFSVHLHKSVKDDWSKAAIALGALAVLYFSVPYTAQIAKQHLNVKVPMQFTYLALLFEGVSVIYNRSSVK